MEADSEGRLDSRVTCSGKERFGADVVVVVAGEETIPGTADVETGLEDVGCGKISTIEIG